MFRPHSLSLSRAKYRIIAIISAISALLRQLAQQEVVYFRAGCCVYIQRRRHKRLFTEITRAHTLYFSNVKELPFAAACVYAHAHNATLIGRLSLSLAHTLQSRIIFPPCFLLACVNKKNTGKLHVYSVNHAAKRIL